MRVESVLEDSEDLAFECTGGLEVDVTQPSPLQVCFHEGKPCFDCGGQGVPQPVGHEVETVARVPVRQSRAFSDDDVVIGELRVRKTSHPILPERAEARSPLRGIARVESVVAPRMDCRAGCGACCIAPSISSPIPGMPGGKPAGVRCVQLSGDNRCMLFGDARRPAVCDTLRASLEMCGSSAADALRYLADLEAATVPR